MIEYLDLLDNVLSRGTPRHGEKPEGTLTVFGEQVKYDLRHGFPLLTTRDMTGSWERIIKAETKWIISGSSSATELEQKYGCTLWNRWAEESRIKIGTPPGELGKIYGYQLRHWNDHTDQLKEIVEMLKRTPETRRAMISLWNLDDVEIGGTKFVNVANCITQLHFSRMNYKLSDDIYEPRLDLIMTHRSADIPAGVPHDVPEFALLLMLVAREVGLEPGTLTDNIDDGQIYDIQREKVLELLNRPTFVRPRVTITAGSIFEIDQIDFELHGYQHGEKLRIPVAS